MSCSFANIFILVFLAYILSNSFGGFSAAKASALIYEPNYNYQCIVTYQEPVQPSTPPESESTKTLEDNFLKGNLQFTSNFLYNVVQENPYNSVTISPFSTLFLLAELALYATGETGQQLLSALNLKDQNEIRKVIPEILDSIAEQKNVTLDLAERVYGNSKSNFSDSFKKDTNNIFRAEAENIDFDNAQRAADIINKWVQDQTNNKIQDLVPASALTPNTQLVLVNALYFLGEWRYKFKTYNTKPQTFYEAENKTILVDTMNQVNFFQYTESSDINAQAIELPYLDGNLTFFILLPNDKDGAKNLVTKLLDPNVFTSVRNSLQSTNVNLSLPKFNTTTTTDLKSILKKLNITDLFDPSTSGLSGILAEPRKIYVTTGIQKTLVAVYESGSEAAAGTAIIGVGAALAPAPPTVFNADHPFIYYLLFRGTPIFCGLFAGN